ncbi:MAG: GNAT family N-acetyltransferase [bacterium]
MVVEQLAPEAAAEWDAFVDGRADATWYHRRAWQDVAQRAYGLSAPFLIARDAPGGPAAGVLPLFVVRNPRGGYSTTGLFGAYGCVLARSQEAGRALLDEARAITRAKRLRFFTHKSLGDDEPSARDLVRHDDFVIAVLSLEGGEDAVWSAFRSEIRNRIRKAERSGLVVRDGPQELDGYYDVLAENMHRKGTPIYGMPLMRELVRSFAGDAEILTLEKDGRTVSGALVVYDKKTTYVPFVSSRASTFQLNPNNLLYWEIIKRSCRRGVTLLDFGRSPKDSSNLEFKLRWGASTLPQPFYMYAPRGDPPRMNARDPAVQRLVRLWQRLPRTLADALGPAICRSFLA